MIVTHSRIVTVISAVVICLLQLVLASAISLFGAIPNFIAAYMIVLAIVRSSAPPVVLAFIVGLFYGFAAGGPVGGMAFLLVLITFLAARTFSVLANDSLFMSIVALLTFSVALELFYALLLIAFGLEVSLIDAFVRRVLPCALYDTVAGLIMYPLVTKLVVESSAPREPLETTNLR